MARELNVEVAAIKAIIQQESQGYPYLDNGLPSILYERTLFYRFSVQKMVDAAAAAEKIEKKDKKSKGRKKAFAVINPYPAHPDLCFPTRAPYGVGGLGQYEKLARACTLDFELALRATSWGGFQILGDNFKACGYATVFDFVNEFMSGTDGQVKIFVAFMQKVKPLALAGLREHDWVKVARGYNGKYWETVNPDYPKNLGKFYDSFK
ncbi:N-acetylmuramidase family protein [Burkholderia sp. BCC1644]|uniref:N-acetylmuramidase family protein n=1 Tax=Burkholderia sp. BCC1644 TaxID=2676293 RepID=UPI001FC8C220|nr:N-acetylmuramidase family protein [Burkholderia sp. BCC1644]